MEQRVHSLDPLIQKLNDDQNNNEMDIINQMCDLINLKQSSSTNFDVDEINKIISLLEEDSGECKDATLKCFDILSKKSTDQISFLIQQILESNLSIALEKFIFSSNEKFLNQILEIYKNLFNYKPPSPSRYFDYYDYIMLKINESSGKIKTKLSRQALPMIKRLLNSDDEALLNRGYLLIQSYYDSNFSNKSKFLYMYGIDKTIKELVDKKIFTSEEKVDYLKKILSEIDIFSMYKKECREGSIDYLFSNLVKDLSYENSVEMEEKEGIIRNLCYGIKEYMVYDDYLDLLDYMLFIGEEKRLRENLEMNAFIQKFIYNDGDKIVDQYQYQRKKCEEIIQTYLPYRYDHFQEDCFSGDQYLVDKDKARKIIKRKVEDGEKKKIKRIKINNLSKCKIELYIQSIKTINSFYNVEFIASVYIKEINSNEIVIKEKEFKMNLGEVKDKNELRKRFFNISLNILRGIETIHDLNMVHGNVNLNNIFIDENFSYIDDQFKNIVRDIQDIPLSSVQFLSPEYLSSSEITQESDVFSLGIVMNYLLNGKILFDGDTLKIISSKIINSEKIIIENENEELKNLINRMINRKKEERPFLKEVKLVIEKEYSFSDEYIDYGDYGLNDYLLEILISNNILLPELDYYGCYVIIIDKYNETRLLCYYGTLLNIEWKNTDFDFNGYNLRLHFIDNTNGDEEERDMEMDDLVHLASYKYTIDLSNILYDENQKLVNLASYFPFIPQLKELDLSENEAIQFKYIKVLVDGLSYLTNLEKLNLLCADLSNKTTKYIRNFDEIIRPSILPQLEILYHKGENQFEYEDDDDEEGEEEEEDL